MTTKTETLYRFKGRPKDEIKISSQNNIGLNRCYDGMFFDLEPVQVHVGEFWVRKFKPSHDKIGDEWAHLEYEKVTNVLPNHIPDGGKMVCDEIKELQKKVEELEGILETEKMASTILKQTIESQKREIELKREQMDEQSTKIINAWSEIDILKSELLEVRVDRDCQALEKERLKGELLTTTLALRDEVDRRIKAEKENLYLKRSFVQDGSAPLEKCIEQAKQLQNLDSKIVELKNTMIKQERDFKEVNAVAEKYFERMNELEKELEGEKERYDSLQIDFNNARFQAERHKKELEEAKKGGVVWEENKQDQATHHLFIDDGIAMYHRGFRCVIPFPPLPQPRTVEDEANEAWEKFTESDKYDDQFRDDWIEGYLAKSQEPKGEK